jgi:hypothetical protein
VVRRPICIGEVAVAGVLIDALATARPYEGPVVETGSAVI